MTSKAGQNGDILEDKGRRDFARSALAAGGALLIGPKLMAAPAPTADGAAVSTSFPKHIYFYYLTLESKAKHPTVQAFHFERSKPIDNITLLMEQLSRAAQAEVITPIGEAMGDIRWAHRSYLAIVLDHKTIKLTKDMVKFKYIADEGTHCSEGFTHDEAHSFENFSNFSVSGTGLTGMYCINKVTKYGTQNPGEPLAHGERENFSIQFSELTTAGKRGAGLTHSDTGTNTGPPHQ